MASERRWFYFICRCERRDLVSRCQGFVRLYFKDDLKPFDSEAQKAARFSAAFYGTLSAARSLLKPEP